LAFAELLGLRMAAAGSGAQPADLLASLLPNRESLPEGWLDSFLAGTPIPGVNGAVSIPGPSTLPPGVLAPGSGESPPNQTGSVDSALATLIRVISSTESSAPAADTASGLPPGGPSQTGWETVPPLIGSGISGPDLDALVKRLCGGRNRRNPGSPPPQPGRADPRAGSTPPFGPGTGPRHSSTAPEPGQGKNGKTTGSLGSVQIKVEFDAHKLVAEMKRVAETVTHRIVNLQTQIYAAQTRGTITGRR
jgi:hypothetical protein